MANFELPNGITVEAPDDWTADMVMAEYAKGNLGPTGDNRPWTDRLHSYLTDTGPARRTGSYLEEAAAPFVEAYKAWQEPPKPSYLPTFPIDFPTLLKTAQTIGAPFQAAGNVTERAIERLTPGMQSTPVSRLGGLAAETLFPAGTLTKWGLGALRAAKGASAAGDVAKILQEGGIPAEQITEALGELKSVVPAAEEVAAPVRPFTVSELLARAKQTQNPVAAETNAERILRQTKNIDVGAHTPSIFDTAEDLVNRRAYKPVETRALFEPEAVRDAAYTERELEAMNAPGPLSKEAKLQQYRERIGLAEPAAPVTDKAVLEAEQAAPAVLQADKPFAQRLVEWVQKTAKTAPGVRMGPKLYDELLSPILSRLESLGPEGVEMSRLEQKRAQVATFLFRDIIEPLYNRLHKLNDAEMANFVDTVQGGAPPISNAVTDSALHWDKVFGTDGLIVNAFRERGINISPRENFFAREFAPKVRNAILNDKAYQSELIGKIAEENGISRMEAKRALLATIGRKPILGRDRKVAAEYARSVDLPDYLQNPAQVTAMRGWSVANRLAELSVYGAKDENIMNAIRAATARDPQLGDQLHKLFELTIRRNPIDAGLAEMSRKAMTWQAITKLPLAAIPNLGQPVLSVLRTNLATATLGFLKTLRPGTREAAREVGMAVDLIVRRNLIELQGGPTSKLSNFVLGPFNIVEKAIRAVAVQQADVWASKLQGLVQRGVDQPWLRRELGNLLFSPTEIHNIMVAKTLSPEDLRQIRYAVAEQVVFVPRSARRSAAMLSDPKLAVLLQFKNFISNSTRLLKNAVVDDARRGNIRPLYHVLSAVLPSVLVGEVIGDLRAFARGSTRPPIGTTSQIGWRALDNVMSIGSLGIGLDLLNATGGDPAGLITWGAGPTFGDVARTGFRATNILENTAKGNWPEVGRQLYETGRFAARQIPIGGSFIVNRFLPSSVQHQTFPDETYWDRIGFTERARERARYLDQLKRLQSQRGLQSIRSNLGIE